MADEQGGAARLEGFCRAEYPRLVGMLDLYCGDLGVAEELAQEALTRAYRHWKRVSSLDKPDAWVRRAAINLANSHFRRKKAERKARERMEVGRPTESDLAGDIALRETIAQLPAKMKTALILRYYNDLPFVAVAEHMQVPEATARSLVHRAIRRLRDDGGMTDLQEAFRV